MTELANDFVREPDRIDIEPAAEGGGCHGGGDTLREAARKHGESD